jgi:hypothetical protein
LAAASIIWAAIFLPFSISLSAAMVTAPPARIAEREPKVPMPLSTRSVSPY